MTELIVHVGYPKCASTMLQKQLFHAQPGLRVVHDAETVDALTLADHPGGEAGRRAVLETLADSIDDATTPVVITCEHLCMPGCWIQTDAGIGRRRLSRRDINALLQGYLPPARILLIVREQRRWLPSWYQQRIKAYETQTMSQLIDSAMFRDEIVPALCYACLLYTSPSPRDQRGSRMPSSA